eukprot:SAG11_NODE_22115_length_412_cov_0.450479_1_plen_52_part_10
MTRSLRPGLSHHRTSPPLLVFENGTRVETPEAWAARRSEVWRLAQPTFPGTT